MSGPSLPYEALGIVQTSAAILSFMSSLRIFGVIVSAKDLRLMTSYQLIAYIALFECCQMTSTSVVGIMIAMHDTFNELLLDAIADIAVITWITLIWLRFSLAVNRFTVITSFSRLRFLKSNFVLWATLLFPTCALAAMIVFCILNKLPHSIDVELAGWNFDKVVLVSYIEKFSATILTLCTFLLYVIVSLYILKTKNQALSETKLNDVKLLISSGLTFIYEVAIVVIYYCIFPYVEVSALWNGIMGILWAALPAFNGLMLLTVNKSFRQRFFALRC